MGLPRVWFPLLSVAMVETWKCSDEDWHSHAVDLGRLRRSMRSLKWVGENGTRCGCSMWRYSDGNSTVTGSLNATLLFVSGYMFESESGSWSLVDGSSRDID